MHSGGFALMFITSHLHKYKLSARTGVLLWLFGGFCGLEANVAKAQPEPPPKRIVSNTRDSGPGSLREALRQAQTTPETTVVFNIPNTDENFKDGVFTITLERSLPRLRMDNTSLMALRKPSLPVIPIPLGRRLC